MRGYFDTYLSSLSSVQSEAELRLKLVSGIRHALQLANFALLEWVAARLPDPDSQPSNYLLKDLQQPSDGTLVDALESLLICAEQNGWGGASLAILKEIEDENEALQVCGENPANLLGLLRGFVALRNDGAEGHGLAGGYNRSAETAAFAFIIESLHPCLPKLTAVGELTIGPETCEIPLRLIKTFDGQPVLIRRIKEVSTAVARVKAQYYNDSGTPQNISYEAANPFSKFSGRSHPELSDYDNSWSPLCYLPERMTDTFTGRDDEAKKIHDWMNDLDSRACLVFGDGGVGKTTLVIEALHRYLDEDVAVEWRPKVLSFYTAKRTSFTTEGVQPIGAGRPHLKDLLAHVHVLLFSRVPPVDFYRKSVSAAAMYLQERMREDLGFVRSDHLIVVDNAETLIESDEERDSLGEELKEIARRVGRILITSRRREILGADPIEVKALSQIDAVRFLRARGERKLSIQAIKRATDPQLIDIVKSLERRPIVLEAFLNVLTDPQYKTLEKARERVSGMLRRDLGSFLFSDAWMRFSKDVKRLLILMAGVADVHDAQLFRICANICSVSAQDAEKALEESSGIASVVHVDGGINVSFSRNFLDFCRDRGEASSADIARARMEYRQFLKRAQDFSGDRVAAAFRTPVARAAHRAKNEGDLESARKLYEQAIVSDNVNGLLFDRYAYFLFHDMRDYPAALHMARSATQLASAEGEVWYTRGLIEGRLGELRAAEGSLQRAEALGVSEVRCGIQRCWACLITKPRQLALAEKHLLALEARTAAQLPTSRDRIELGHIKSRIAYLRSRTRSG